MISVTTGPLRMFTGADATTEALYAVLLVFLATAATVFYTRGAPRPYADWLVAIIMMGACMLCMLAAVFVVTPYRAVRSVVRVHTPHPRGGDREGDGYRRKRR